MQKNVQMKGTSLGDGIRRFFHPGMKMMVVKIQPGEIYTTSDQELIATGLGSCISACLWDDIAGVGGMNHFMLPFCDADDIEHWSPAQWRTKAARYGNYAMELLINTLLKKGAIKTRLQVKLFGGAMVMGSQATVGEKNIEFIRSYIASEGLILVGEDLGGVLPRKLIFDPLSGKAWVKKLTGYRAQVQAEEKDYGQRLVSEANRGDEDNSELF